MLADNMVLVRHATDHHEELTPFVESVDEWFHGWLAMQETTGRDFTDEQYRWLENIKDHMAGSVSTEPAGHQYDPFVQCGGIGCAYAPFGDGLSSLLYELNVAQSG